MSLRSRLGALQEREFRLLWLGRTASSVGDSLMPVAFAFAVLEVSSIKVLGLSMALFTVSRVVFTLAGGVWADRLPRRQVMVAADVIRAAGQATLAVLLISGHAESWQFVVNSVLFGAASAFFGPASTSLVKDVISAARLQQANALLSISQSASGTVGPALAGLIVVAVGPGWAFAVDAASFVVSAAFLLALRLRPRQRRAEKQAFLADLAEGWREVVSRSWLWVSLIAFSIGNLGLAAFFVLGPLVAQDELGGASRWGLIVAAGSAGGLVGGLIALRWSPVRPVLPSYVLMVFVVGALVALAAPAPVGVIAIANALGFLSIALGNALWETVLQQHIASSVLARVSAYDWLVSLIFMPLGFTLAPPLAEAVGVRETLLGAAALVAAANVLALLVPSIRELRRTDDVPTEAPDLSFERPSPVAILD
jgi:MFS family permease